MARSVDRIELYHFTILFFYLILTAFFGMEQVLIQSRIVFQSSKLTSVSVDTFHDLWYWKPHRLHQLHDVHSSIHVIIVCMRDEDLFKVTILFCHEACDIFQEQIVIFLTGIDKVPLFATADGEAVGATEHPRVKVFSRNEPDCTLFIKLNVVFTA